MCHFEGSTSLTIKIIATQWRRHESNNLTVHFLALGHWITYSMVIHLTGHNEVNSMAASGISIVFCHFVQAHMRDAVTRNFCQLR